MSLNTQAFTPSTPQSGKSADGRAADGGQSAQETAAEFHSLMQGMKKGDAVGAGGGGQSGTQDGQAEDGKGDVSQETVEPQAEGDAKAEGGETGKSAFISFTTSNLADALRQVSQKILSKPANDGEGSETRTGGGPGSADPDSKGSGQSAAQASTALPITAVLAIPADQNRQTAAPGSQDQVLRQRQSSVGAQGKTGLAVETDGSAKTGSSSLFAQFGVEPERVTDGASGRSAGRSMLPEDAAGTVKILRQETHFAPNLRLSPVQQVGDQIVSAMKDMPSGPAARQTGLSTRAEGPVLKTLDIQLTPHELGSVKVSLRMVGDTVEVTLVASKAQTAELLKQDRQLLDQMLRVTGMKADAITVQAADDRPAMHTGASANGQSAAGQNGSGEGQAQSFNGGGSEQQNNRSDRNNPEGSFQSNEANAIETTEGAGHENTSDISLSDGIYL
ncbi:flagellar hook-length control protein FliK [Roseibium marinum]|uniref:Flagellar hook-length control protein FliK n=1 Tax=Roseibium marinum TaxID=281252 RepID=A0A2S3UQZ9_9HYPH|nr:flagellar hook-length control protein FliK [Roseibium marinum]POF30142.1 flagellar hook-length control protein FliK [Roseibium marinum]